MVVLTQGRTAWRGSTGFRETDPVELFRRGRPTPRALRGTDTQRGLERGAKVLLQRNLTVEFSAVAR